MATLTGKKISESYKDLLQVSNSNSGVDGTLRDIEDGEGTTSILQISSSSINIKDDGALQINETAVTSTAAELNLLDGVTATTAEINYLDGVTSNIQTQLNSKIEATLTTEQVQDIVGGMLTGNTETRITVDYQDGDGTIDFVVDDMTADTNTFRTVTAGGNTLGASETLAFTEGSNITITESGGAVTIAATDTNTQLSNAQVRTAVEAATDSNVFTDDDHTKLNSIESNADVTDASNVAGAGALMDSELASIADVKALDQSVISGASPTFGTANMSDATNKRFMTDAQETKLDSVESNSTADQTASDIRALGFFDTSNDGATSGLDSDKLDGEHGSHYLDFGNFAIDDDEIPIAKLASDNVSYGGVTVTLGASDATPAFDLSDATSLPIVAGTSGTLSVARGGTGATSLNDLITLGTHTTGNYVAAVAGTSNEIEVSGSAGEGATFTVGLPDDVTIGGDLSVTGDLQVNGTTTTVNQTNLDVSDNIIGLNRGISSNSNDSGLIIERGSTGNNAAIIWDESEDKFKIGTTTSDASSTGSLTVATGTLIAALEGNASTATTLANSRDISLTGDVTGTTATAFDGSADVSIAVSIANNSVDLTTHTTGNYVATLTAGNLIDLQNNSGEGATPTIDVDLSELSTSTSDGDGDFFAVVDSSDAQKKLTKGNINLSGFNNDSGFTSNTGDITRVNITAGAGLSGTTDTTSGDHSQTLVFDGNSLTDMTEGMVTGDEFIVLDGTASRKKEASEIGLSIFNNDVGFTTDTQLTTEQVQDIVGAMFTSTNTETRITATYQDATGDIDLVVDDMTANTMGSGFVIEDGDGTEVQITENKEIKFVEGGGININFTDVSDGSDSDPFDLTFELASHSASLLGSGTVPLARLSGISDGQIASDAAIAITKLAESAITINGTSVSLGGSTTIASPITALNNATANELVTVGSTTTELDAESGLTYDGDMLTVSGSGGTDGAAGSPTLRINNTVQSTDWDTGDVVGTLEFYAEDSSGNAPYVTSYIKSVAETGNGTLPGGALTFGVSDYNASGGAAEAMRITEDSNVGIGTTSPTDTLQVEGSIGVGVGRDGQLTSVNNGLAMRSLVSDADMFFYVNDGGVDTLALKIDASHVGNVLLPNDNQGLFLGAGNDLEIFHDGTDTKIKNNTGDFYISNDANDKDLILRSDDGSGGQTAYLTLDGSAGFTVAQKRIRFNDNVLASFGDGQDAYIYHDGTDTQIVNENGDLFIQNLANDKDIRFRSDDGSGGVAEYFRVDGSSVATIVSKNFAFIDNVKARFGTDDDFEFYSDNSNNYINVTNNNLIIEQNANDKDIILKSDDGSGGATPYLTLDGSATNVITHQQFCFEDTNAVINRVSNDLEIRTYGGNDINLMAAGNVGIGTTSPDAKLEVTGGTATDLFSLEGAGSNFKLLAESGNSNSSNIMSYRISLDYLAGTATNGFIDFYRGSDGANGFLTFGTSGNERMRIDGSGNVGIGETGPTHKLQVASAGSSDSVIRINADNARGANRYALDIVDDDTNSRGSVRISTTSGPSLIATGGNVGIHTTSPRLPLHVASPDGDDDPASASATGAFFVTNSAASYGLHMGVSSDGSGWIQSQSVTSANEYNLNLNPIGGNIGIGTSSPGALFTVRKDGTQASSVSTSYQIQTVSNSNGGIAIQAGDSSKGLLVFGDNGNYDAGQIEYYNSSHDMAFSTNETEALRIDSSQNVLIGGTSASGHGFNLEVLNDHAYVKGPDGWDGNGDKAIVALGSGVSNESFGCGYVYGTGLVLSTYKPSGGGHFGSSTQNSLIIADTTGQASFINDVVAFASSDIRLKENVKPLDNALDKINKINGVEFDWIDGKDEHGNSVHGNEGHDVGVIAQEIEEVLPEVVQTRDNGYKAVKYEKIVPLLIEAIKEQQEQINELKEKLNG